MLNKEQIAKEMEESLLNKFNEIEFNEELHRYTIDGERLVSTSKTYGEFKKEFDADTIASFVAKSRGVNKENILEEWDMLRNIAIERGNSLHEFAENIYHEMDLKPSNPLEEAFMKFWTTLPDNLVPVAAELQMYCKTLGIAGTCDLLLLNLNTNKLVVVDYKTNKDIHKNYKGQKLIGLFSDVLDTPLNGYKLQLSIYQILLERMGFEVEDRFIIWVKDSGEFEQIHTESYSEILSDFLICEDES